MVRVAGVAWGSTPEARPPGWISSYTQVTTVGVRARVRKPSRGYSSKDRVRER